MMSWCRLVREMHWGGATGQPGSCTSAHLKILSALHHMVVGHLQQTMVRACNVTAARGAWARPSADCSQCSAAQCRIKLICDFIRP